MKRHGIYSICAIFIAVFMIASMLAGCGAKTDADSSSTPSKSSAADAPVSPEADTGETDGAPISPDAGEDDPADSAPVDAAEGDTEEDLPPDTGDGPVRVDSVEELVEAIRPGADIIIEPGYYDLTDFLANFPNARDRDAWNEQHEYVEIAAAYDGQELVIKNTDDLSISGGTDDPAETEIVTQPRYAAVLNFSDCKNIGLSCLTMGHTDAGDCSGNVLDFENTRDIYLRSLDLYGCGVYGIGCYELSGNLYVSDSTIRDCAYGPFDICEGDGDFSFTACTLSGSDGGGYFETNETSQLSFTGCSFGQRESNIWYWSEEALFEDCDFMEPTEYPDYGYDDYYYDYGEYDYEYYDEYDYDYYVPAFDPDQMVEYSFDKSMLEGSLWIGYAVVDPGSGDTRYMTVTDDIYPDSEYAALSLYDDGTGRMIYCSESFDFDWYCMDTNLACLENEDRRIYITLYSDDDDYIWLGMQYDDEYIWFF